MSTARYYLHNNQSKLVRYFGPSRSPEYFVPGKGWVKYHCGDLSQTGNEKNRLECDYNEIDIDDVDRAIENIETSAVDEIESRPHKELHLEEHLVTDLEFALKLFTDAALIGEWLGYMTICRFDETAKHMGIMVGQDHELDWYYKKVESNCIELTQVYGGDSSKEHIIKIYLTETSSGVDVKVSISGKFTPKIEQDILNDWECLELIQSEVISGNGI